MIALFLTGNEHRGNDAAGMAFMQANGDVHVCKMDIPAWKFTCSEEYEKFIDTYLKDDTVACILHARGASKGNPRDNQNNHPMFVGQSAVIHNGHIKNDDEIFEKQHLQRRADTDSDILRAIFDADGFTEEAFKKLNKLNGSAAGAVLSSRYPGKLLLFKSGSPMNIASTEDFLFFSSELKTIHQACKPVFQRFGIWFQGKEPQLAFTNIPEHSYWILGPNGCEAHGEFKTCREAYKEPVRRVYEDYQDRQMRWDKEKESKKKKLKSNVDIKLKDGDDRIIYPCSNPQCDRVWMLSRKQDPRKFECDRKKGGCGAGLLPTPIAPVEDLTI